MGYSSTRLELTSLAYVKSSTTLFSLSYGYTSGQGNNGQVTNITDNVDNGRSVSYTYDPLGRLASATTVGSTNYAQWGVSETYDRYGNRLSQSASAGSPPTPSLSFGDHGGAQTNRADTFSYDANGNMLGDGVNTSMTYDATNRLISLSNGTTGGASYVYDGNGLRVEKTTGGATTVYVFSGSKVLAEYTYGAAPSSPSKEYVYSGSQLIYTADSSVKYHLRDHLSVRVNTDVNGNVIGQQGHYPFGESWYLNSTTTKWQFTGYERDAESGTGAAGSGNDYAMARYYVNRFGRFSSLDPLSGSLGNPQSLNHYAYVTNDPINATDPTGMSGDYMIDADVCGDSYFQTGSSCYPDGGIVYAGNYLGSGYYGMIPCAYLGCYYPAPDPNAPQDPDPSILDPEPLQDQFLSQIVPTASTATGNSHGSDPTGGGCAAPASLLPHSFGPAISVTAALGASQSLFSGAATGGAAWGGYNSPSAGWSSGFTATGGAMLQSGSVMPGGQWTVSSPQQQLPASSAGAFVGAGGGMWVSNATSRGQMLGTFNNVITDGGYLGKLGFTFAWGNGVWVFSANMGGGAGGHATAITTNTVPLFSKPGCK